MTAAEVPSRARASAVTVKPEGGSVSVPPDISMATHGGVRLVISFAHALQDFSHTDGIPTVTL